MPNLFVFAHLPFAKEEFRQTAQEKLAKISEYTKQNEPDTLRYFFSVPREESDVKSIYVIEEYASRAAFDAHMATENVNDIVAWLNGNTQHFKGESTVNMAEVDASFIRPDTVNAKDPWICYTSIKYKDGKRAMALEHWKHVASETEKNEANTLSYSILTDSGNPEIVRTVGVYASQEYFKEVHIPSKAVQENATNFGDEIRESVQHVFLQYRGGFFGR